VVSQCWTTRLKSRFSASDFQCIYISLRPDVMCVFQGSSHFLHLNCREVFLKLWPDFEKCATAQTSCVVFQGSYFLHLNCREVFLKLWPDFEKCATAQTSCVVFQGSYFLHLNCREVFLRVECAFSCSVCSITSVFIE